MHVGVALEPFVQEVDEGLERALLPGPVVSPERAKPRLALVDGDCAEEILEPVLIQRVTLHVEEHVG